MSLRLLDDCARSSLRSGVTISSISQCVEELVLNSIDAGAQSITIRIDLPKFLIQIIDNGTGVSWDDLQLLGERYATSKCCRLSDLSYHGYRGEAIASIISCCGSVEFTTRHCLSSVTYSKIFRCGHSFGINVSPGCSNIGTTVTIRDIFYNLPVRKKVICDVAECDKIRRMIMTIALINPNISFFLRNDQTSERLIQSKKTNSILKNFEQLLGTELSLGLQEVSASKNGFKVSGYVSTRSHYTKLYQFIYINKRFIKNTRLHSLVNQLLSKSLVISKATKHVSQKSLLDENDQRQFFDAYGVFVLNIECLLVEYDICLDPAKTLVDFKRWDDVLSAIEIAVTDFLVKNNLNINVPICTLAGRSKNISGCLVVPNSSQTTTYGLQSRAVQRNSVVLQNPCVIHVGDSEIGQTNHTTLNNEKLKYHHGPSTIEQTNHSVNSSDSLLSSLSTIGQMAANGYNENNARKKLIRSTRSLSITSLDSGKLLKQRKIAVDEKLSEPDEYNDNKNVLELFGNKSRTIRTDSVHIKLPLHIRSCTTASKQHHLEKTINQSSTDAYNCDDIECEFCQTDTLRAPFKRKECVLDKEKNAIKESICCTSSGRTVMTTNSLITPLSRDDHMADKQYSHLTRNRNNQDNNVHDGSFSHGCHVTNKDPVTIQREYDTGCINSSLLSDDQSLLESNDNSIGLISKSNSFTDNDDVMEQEDSSAKFEHFLIRAAPHLSSGFTPIKPRRKELRGFTKLYDKEKAGKVSSMCNNLPLSKWRDKPNISNILSDWKNPTFSAGDIDILNIGSSYETSTGIKVHSLIHPYKFTNYDFRKFEVLGQVDHKFIACLLQTDDVITSAKRLLVFFDQHAVHERIRLESLIESAYCSNGKIISIDINPPQIILLNKTEKRQSLIYKQQLEAVGVRLCYRDEKVLVCSMPSAFSESGKGDSVIAMELIKELIIKQLDLLCSTGGVCSTSNVPSTLQHVLNSKACHGAIKFGDPLTISECTELIHSLSLCKLPFQCAHGRPSLIPILDLTVLQRTFPTHSESTYRINTGKLKMLLKKQ